MVQFSKAREEKINKEYEQLVGWEDFLMYLVALNEDCDDNPEGWKDLSLDEFLQRIDNYVRNEIRESDEGGNELEQNKPSWKLFATIIRESLIS